MKTISILSTLLFISVLSMAQITFSEFEVQIEADMEKLPPKSAITASSDCGKVTLTMKDTKFSGGCAGVLNRDYLAVDECGNEAKTTQFIRLIDSTPPELKKFTKEIVIDKNDIPEPITPEFHDANSSKLDIEFSEKRNKIAIVRTWTATDACGNSSTASQRLVFKSDL